MDFNALSRRELQALCKRNGVRANMTNAAMAEALRALASVDGIDEMKRDRIKDVKIPGVALRSTQNQKAAGPMEAEQPVIHAATAKLTTRSTKRIPKGEEEGVTKLLEEQNTEGEPVDGEEVEEKEPANVEKSAPLSAMEDSTTLQQLLEDLRVMNLRKLQAIYKELLATEAAEGKRSPPSEADYNTCFIT